MRAQVEGRSLVPLIERADAPWAERTLFTHVGRWAKGSDPALAKFRNCAVREPQWHLVSAAGGGAAPAWQLFEVKSDPGEQTDMAVRSPEVVKRMAAAYDRWWSDVQPMLVNEQAPFARTNPFKEIYWKQFGVEPTAEDLRAMDHKREFPDGSGAAKKKKTE